jgi:hypothetical protein
VFVLSLFFTGVDSRILYLRIVNTLPASDFFRGLLYFYGLQLHHLNLNSINHVANFVHLYEAFLGIEPHFAIFRYLFRVKPQPSLEN